MKFTYFTRSKVTRLNCTAWPNFNFPAIYKTNVESSEPHLRKDFLEPYTGRCRKPNKIIQAYFLITVKGVSYDYFYDPSKKLPGQLKR